ncbi:hypothetical protein ACWOAH_09910 [Vagococcus vulneris]|uniref:Uncharacterized protein n=1 Tax=Vagococcus vulneris TaxID=1977869 RepID=A0A429ZWT6_9ENTE|nr:hypothetical protein [Vagococcus vulneris]RST98271.1 hypothetical protein CBF37_08135 [Vagococcus vulneris]
MVAIIGIIIGIILAIISMNLSWGSVPDWLSAIGTVGAFWYIIKQMRQDKEEKKQKDYKDNYDNLYSKMNMLLTELEKKEIKDTISLYELGGIAGHVFPEPEIFNDIQYGLKSPSIPDYKSFKKVWSIATKQVNDEDASTGDYLRTLNLLLTEVNKYKDNHYLNEADLKFIIELIRIKITKEGYNLILWNALFSPYSEKLNINLRGLGIFSKKSKEEFLALFLYQRADIQEGVKEEIVKFDYKK